VTSIVKLLEARVASTASLSVNGADARVDVAIDNPAEPAVSTTKTTTEPRAVTRPFNTCPRIRVRTVFILADKRERQAAEFPPLPARPYRRSPAQRPREHMGDRWVATVGRAARDLAGRNLELDLCQRNLADERLSLIHGKASNGQSTTFKVSPLPLEKMGDESGAWTVTETSFDIPCAGDVILPPREALTGVLVGK
jgi:hypothetical protein